MRRAGAGLGHRRHRSDATRAQAPAPDAATASPDAASAPAASPAAATTSPAPASAPA